MSASTSGGPLPTHTRVASIRFAPTQTGQPASSATTPHTPQRTTSASYGSPATLRADDDVIILELGSRRIRAGFAGDSTPKATLTCGPEEQRRPGDFRQWQAPSHRLDLWSEENEIWRHDLRDFDLGLFQDKFDRLLREAFTKYLLIDSRPRRAALVLDSASPLPLLSSVLDILFSRYQTPSVSILSSATMCAVGAGLRSALVVDMGWTETVITSVYEYREVKSSRTVRGGKYLLNRLYDYLEGLVDEKIVGEAEAQGREGTTEPSKEEDKKHIISFQECEDIIYRLMWCRSSVLGLSQRQSAQLETVEEQDESETEGQSAAKSPGFAEIPLQSLPDPKTVKVPFDKLADLCDNTFFTPSSSKTTFDDHDLPVPALLHQHLLEVPIDVRAICLPRITFTGGCSNILGMKERLLDELTSLIDRKGWEPASGKRVDQLRSPNSKLQRDSVLSQASDASLPLSEGSEDSEATVKSAASSEPEHDPIEAKVRRHRQVPPLLQGQVKAVHTLGPWAGASILSQLKIPAIAMVDRELWLQHGVYGASRASEVDVKAQRQSMAAAGILRSGGGGGGHHTSWTLGAWGS